MFEIDTYLEQIVSVAPGVREIWLVGSRANGTARPDSDWDFIVFGDSHTFSQLQAAADLHRIDVDCLVVSDSDAFESAWGSKSKRGSLSKWKWRPDSNGLWAIYEESKWHGAEDGACVKTADRFAVRKWPAP
jgi:predicted nucleotidyltransferase